MRIEIGKYVEPVGCRRRIGEEMKRAVESIFNFFRRDDSKFERYLEALAERIL